jgi:hypothetical protein
MGSCPSIAMRTALEDHAIERLAGSERLMCQGLASWRI